MTLASPLRKVASKLMAKFGGDVLNRNATANRWEASDRLSLLEARVTAPEP
jgi:hypothetical protein